MANMEPLARVFSDALRKEIGADKLAEVVRLNATEVPGTVCHSHDFCDANVVMDVAWKSVFGREVRLPCDAEDGHCTHEQVDEDLRRWELAWTMAVVNRFFT